MKYFSKTFDSSAVDFHWRKMMMARIENHDRESVCQGTVKSIRIFFNQSNISVTQLILKWIKMRMARIENLTESPSIKA